MKRSIALLVFCGLATILSAQAPLKMSYQAVIRNSSNQLITNSPVGMRFSILKGFETGAAVYIETQTAFTNANGLVTVEIGSGNVVFGGLGIVVWADGPYFLKTETDPTGGTNYTIGGTSQLSTVPYALYAVQAGNGFSGSYSDLTNKPTLFDGTWLSLTGKPNFATVSTSGSYTDLTNKPSLFDGTWLSLTGKPSFATVSTSGSYTDLTNKPALFSGNYNDLSNKPALAPVATSGSYNDLSNKPVTDGSETKVSSGTNISVSGSGTSATPYIINLDIPHYVGELYGGGVVFHVDHTGKHGLICSMVDLSFEKWSNISDEIGITSQSPWDGQTNTNAIITQAGHTSGAAKLCDGYTNINYGTGIYSDWFLPSINQLSALNYVMYEVNKALDSDGNSSTKTIHKLSYWSSSEWKNPGTINYGNAIYYDFESSKVGWYTKNNALYVLPIRAF